VRLRKTLNVCPCSASSGCNRYLKIGISSSPTKTGTKKTQAKGTHPVHLARRLAQQVLHTPQLTWEHRFVHPEYPHEPRHQPLFKGFLPITGRDTYNSQWGELFTVSISSSPPVPGSLPRSSPSHPRPPLQKIRNTLISNATPLLRARTH
jgi:hypothetical protein